MRYFLLFLCCFTIAHAAENLLLCVVTAHRPQSYLEPLVTALREQNANFVVVDVDNSTEGEYLNLQESPYECTVGTVSCPAQRQGVDLVRGLQFCAGTSNASYVGLIEDDMLPCNESIHTMEQTLSKLSDFKTARFAKFSRATIFPRAHVALYTQYVMRHVHETPHDILLKFEWASGDDYIHPRSLFAHQGQISTIEERNDPLFIKTYSSIREEVCEGPLVGK